MSADSATCLPSAVTEQTVVVGTRGAEMVWRSLPEGGLAWLLAARAEVPFAVSLEVY